MDEGQKKYREMKKALGWNNKDVADRLGHTEGSVKVATMPGKELSSSYKLAVAVFEELGNGCNWTYNPSIKD